MLGAGLSTGDGGVLGLAQGRSADNWVDWNFYGHQLVTHEVATPRDPDAGHSSVDDHRVPVPHFGLLLSIVDFQELADEAFSDLLKKHGRPTDRKTALRESVKKEESTRPISKKGPSRP